MSDITTMTHDELLDEYRKQSRDLHGADRQIVTLESEVARLKVQLERSEAHAAHLSRELLRESVARIELTRVGRGGERAMKGEV